MSRSTLDLSARPFANRRPVVRLSILLWVIGGLLLAGNVWLYWDFIAGRGNLHEQLRDAERQIEIEEERIADLRRELSSFDLADQNAQVTYLNERIDQRRFSWSQLFEELSDLLPRDVRLTTLAPRTAEESSSRSRSPGSADTDRVQLVIRAQARTDEAILEMVDALFADPKFERPNLSQQRDVNETVIDFDIQVDYIADRPLDAAVLDAVEGEGGEDGDGAVIVPEGAADSGADEGAAGRRPAPLGRPASSPPEMS